MPTYTVQRGDTLAKIAVANNTSVEALARNNNIQDPNLIFVGQTIELPYGERDAPGGDAPAPSRGGEYVVHSGDTLSKIARDNGTTVQEIMRTNPGITNPDRIYVGQGIRLPQAGAQNPAQNSALNASPAQGSFNIPAQMAANARAEPGAGGPPIPMAHPGRPATPGPIDYGDWQPIQPENEQVRLAQQANDPMMFSTSRSLRPQAAPPMGEDQGGMLPVGTDVAQAGYPSNMPVGPPQLTAGNGTLSFGPGEVLPPFVPPAPPPRTPPINVLDVHAGGGPGNMIAPEVDQRAFMLATGNVGEQDPITDRPPWDPLMSTPYELAQNYPEAAAAQESRQFDLATTRFIRSLTGPQWGM